METKELAVIAHPSGEGKSVVAACENSPIFVDTYGGRVRVEWDSAAEVTPFGQLPFFIDFLKTAEDKLNELFQTETVLESKLWVPNGD